jgi:hypothetical protein
MPDTLSAVLSLPYIQPSQAQKHVTHNTALRVLDSITQLAVIARDLDSPPPAAEVGARYIVGGGAAGDWAGQAGAVATREDSGWSFVAPLPGWLAFVTGEGVVVVYDAVLGWDTLTGGADLEAETLGLNTSADATNRLAVAAGATLLSHDGAGHQLKINKATGTDTASLLFQSGFAGHAEMGLAGSTDFSVKVSADGSTWAEALRVDAATAVPHLPQGLLVNGTISGTAVQSGVHDTTAGRLMGTGAFGLGQSGPTPTVTLATAMTSGFFNFAGTDPDSPGGTGGVVIVARYSSQWINQLVFAANQTFMWLRWTKDSGATWSGWSPVFTTANVVGTVSEDAGTPTGAVIERGSTATGDYLRFADGTQICTRTETLAVVTTPLGALHRDAALADWSFPAAFAAPPVVALSCTSPALWVDAGAVTTTAAGRVIWAAQASTGSHIVHAQATGRWF